MKNVLLLLFLLLGGALQAQVPIPTEFQPCGTPPVRSEWLKNYQKNPAAYAAYSRNQTTLFAGMTLHVVGEDNGNGHIDLNRLMLGFCDLNEDYEAVDIQFFIEGDLKFIDSSGWYSHSSVLDGAAMMFANNVANTINCYVVANPAGNAGYNLPYAGIALNKAGASAGSKTWAHEVGHNLSVQHPFLGWEGNTYSYNTPTPTTVTYNYTYFKDTLIVDTLIIDTAFVELVDGSNCTVAGDGFCDTPPDYLAIGGWQCNAQAQSTILQKDPNGVDFRSDATNIMSYANDACVTGFTPQQMAAMRAYLQTERAAYLYNQNPVRTPIASAPNIVSPTANGIEQFDNVQLEWESVTGATHYVVQVSRVASFSLIEFQGIVADTAVTVTNLLNNRNYYWRVKAFNQGYTCAPISPLATFSTQNLVATEGISTIEAFKIYPTLLAQGQSLNVEIDSRRTAEATISVFNLAGQRLKTEVLPLQNGNNRFELSLSLAAGLHIVQVQTADGILTEKILVF